MSLLLLIEDDQTLRRALCLVLEKSGYTVVEAGDGRAGLNACATQSIALVITDLVMPDIEGLELIRALRQANRTLPIIAISGGGRSGDPETYLNYAKQLGAALVLTKPFALEKLTAAVAQLLAEKAATA